MPSNSSTNAAMTTSAISSNAPALVSSSLEPIDLQQYTLVLKRRWKPALTVFATTALAATALASQQKPTYTASSKVVFRSNRLPALTSLAKPEIASTSSPGSLGSLSALTQQNSPLRTETENILSRPVLDRTIAALNLQDQTGKPIKATDLAKEIKVKEVPGADVLKVTYSDRNADRAAQVINQLLQEYIKTNIATTRSEARAAREFVAQELPKAEANVQRLDARLRDFKERNQIADLSGEQQSVTNTLNALGNQITQTNTELSEANARYGHLQGKLAMDPEQALAASALSQSPGVQQAVNQWYDSQSQLQQELTRYKDNHPRTAELKRKEATLRQLLEQRMAQTVNNSIPGDLQQVSLGEAKQTLVKDYLNADMARRSLRDRLQSLLQAQAAYKGRLQQLPQLEQQQRDLQRRLDVAQTTYAGLSQRFQESQLIERQTVGTANIIESAIPSDKPSGSGKVMFVGLGVLLGSLLASAAVLGCELADRSIKTVKEAKEVFGYSCLGTIPFFGNPRQAKRQLGLVPQLPAKDMPRSIVGAAYRMLQANLRFINVDSSLRSVVVTSAIPKEGKSTVAANLAATMAQLGRRVLLIDADLHHPTQHNIWQREPEAGLSDLIAGHVPLRQVVRPAMPNLDLLSAGVMPPNPLAILDSHRMAKLIRGLETVYDLVIIDAPPLMVEAEALTLGRLAQGILLVARPGLLPTQSAKAAKELLDRSGQTVFGLVINSAVLEPETYHHTDYNRDYIAREPLTAMPT
ncbi:MAG: hypothetical protein RLZZ511_270 [Cyanobacteriota bacterium]|jgi:polysaccharide biosynthesis transport protein